MPQIKKKKSKVNFKEELITGVSQEMTPEQHQTLWYFENHAYSCSQCSHPLRVYRNGESLCREGNQKATDIAGLLLSISKDGQIFFHNHRELQDIRIEVPTNYIHCRELLQTIEESDEGFLTKSHDRTFTVPDRVETPRPRARSRPRAVRDYEDPVDDYEDYRPPRRTKSRRRDRRHPGRQSHGSLAQTDLREEDWNDRRESTFSYDDSYQYLQDWYRWQQYNSLYNQLYR